MTVNVECPSCGKAYHVGDESIGAKAKCKSCGATFTLSMSVDETSKSKADAAPVGQAAHSQSAARKAQGQPAAAPVPGKAAHDEMPKKLGQYVVQRKLGAGAMGVVYLARDPILDRQVAVKVLPAELSRDEERLKRFLREAKSAARLHHTNVAAVHQAGAEGRLAYIAMEYVEGMSLDKAASEKKPMEWREATRAIRDAAAGLAAAHAIGLVHRDIKPANLIRTKDGVTKVVDFGLARGQQTNTQLTQQGTLLGTPAYMAPEQWKAGAEIDGRTDLYALTCTYYFLLTGRIPFDAPELAALGYQHRYEPMPDPRQHVPNLPDGICRVLTRGAAKEPSQRYQTAEELVAELEVLLACPDESLTFGSSWAQFAAPAGAELPPPDDPLGAGLAALQTPAVPAAQPAPARTARAKLDIPLWVWIATGGAAAVLLLLGVMIVFSTKYGMVQISVKGAEAKDVQVTLDGETIVIDGLDEPLELKVGEHELTARSPSLETVTRSFQVKKNETTVVEVTFVPKVAAATKSSPEETKPAALPPAMRYPATYRVQIEPPQAILAVSSGSANISGAGRERTITVPDPDTTTKLMLVATLDGYRTLTQELQPVGGETKDLILRLERIPASPPSIAAPPAAPPLAVAPFDAAEAKRHQEAWAAYLNVPVEITNSIAMKLVLIPPGEFMMGSDVSPEEINQRYPGGRADLQQSERPRHTVRLTRPCYLGATEVTVGTFRRFVTATGHRTTAETKGSARQRNADYKWQDVAGMNWQEPGYEQDDTHPVTCVSWDDATAFCDWLSRQEGRPYRLPSEAEWEFACRAGTETTWFWGDDPDDGEGFLNGADLMGSPWGNNWKAPFGFRDGYVTTSPVGRFRANPFGLYDILGNVTEECLDWYGEDYYADSPVDDPLGPSAGSTRVVRGSAWDGGVWGRAAGRGNGLPDERHNTVGFRVAMMLPARGTVSGSATGAERAGPTDGTIAVGPRRYKVTEVRVNEPAAIDRYPSLTVLRDGRIVVAWDHDRAGPGREWYNCWARVFSAAAAPLGPEFPLNPDSTRDHCGAPDLAATADGGLVAVWGNDASGIQHLQFDSQLNAVSEPVLVDSYNSPSVSVSPQGGFVVAWGKVGWGIGFRRFDASGSPVGPSVLTDPRPITIPEQSHPCPVVAHAPNGDFALAWHTGGLEACVRRYHPDGTPCGPALTVATASDYPSIAFTSTDELIVAWRERVADKSNSVFARRYAADGSPVSERWEIDNRVRGAPNVAVGPGDDYLVAWTMDRGEGRNVYARLYDAKDQPLGPSFCAAVRRQGGKQMAVQGGRNHATFVGDDVAIVWFYDRDSDDKGVFLTYLTRVQ